MTLTELLSQTLPKVTYALDELEKAEADGRWFSWPSALRNELATLDGLLADDPIVKGTPKKFFLGRALSPHLNPSHLGTALLRVAHERGVDEALKWLSKICTVEKADMRLILEVHGLNTGQGVDFSNGVVLLPMKDLTASANVRSLRSEYAFRPAGGLRLPSGPPVALVFDLKQEPGTPRDEEYQSRYRLFQNNLLDVARGLSLNDDLKLMALNFWIDFIDPDLARAEDNLWWSSSFHEGSTDYLMREKVTAAHVAEADRYLKLPDRVRVDYALALDRLNLAKRRRAPGDQAIEGSISLESVLGDDERNEMTHKIAVRASILLGKSREERSQILRAIKDFYKLRSSTVHGGKRKSWKADSETAAKGLAISAAVIRRLLEINLPVDLRALDLGDWPPKESES